LILLLTIGLVICAEMMNTAVEEVVNLFVNDYHPIARNAKNVAAGGVLISSIIAAGIGYIVLFEKLLQFDLRSLRSSFRPIDLTLVAILVVIGLSIIVKSAYRQFRLSKRWNAERAYRHCIQPCYCHPCSAAALLWLF